MGATSGRRELRDCGCHCFLILLSFWFKKLCVWETEITLSRLALPASLPKCPQWGLARARAGICHPLPPSRMHMVEPVGPELELGRFSRGAPGVPSSVLSAPGPCNHFVCRGCPDEREQRNNSRYVTAFILTGVAQWSLTAPHIPPGTFGSSESIFGCPNLVVGDQGCCCARHLPPPAERSHCCKWWRLGRSAPGKLHFFLHQIFCGCWLPKWLQTDGTNKRENSSL